MCPNYSYLFISVAVTDLFPLTNQCPCQAIWPHTDQSGTEHIDSFFLSRTFFLAPFRSHDKSESPQLVAKKDLSPVLSYRHPTWKIFTEEHAATSYKLKNEHTIQRHQKRTFSHSDSFTTAIIINLLLLCFQRSFVIYLYRQLICNVMETNH